MRGRICSLAVSFLMAACGVVTFSTSSSTGGGGPGGGGPGAPGGKKGEFKKGDAAWYVQNGDACERQCFQGVPECVNDCVEMRKAYTTTGQDIGKTCNYQKIYSEDNWKDCYKYKQACLDECHTCSFPKQYVESDVPGQYVCGCPPHTGHQTKLPGECVAVNTIAEDEKYCKRYCRQDKERCVNETLAELGYPVTPAKEKKADKKCQPPCTKCYSKCMDVTKDQQKLIEASKTGKVKQVRTLLEKMNVGPFDSDDNFTTPIHFAAMHGQLDVVKVFVEEENVVFTGADFHGNTGAWLPKDAFGKTPLDYAVENGHEDVASYLRMHLGL